MNVTKKNCVSVIMSCYNSMEFLEPAIESVFNQTYNNIELICVDDGSTDNTRKILEQYISEKKNMKILEHDGNENKGQAASFNLALQNCNCEFIAFLDSDDIWFPEKIEFQMDIFHNNEDVDLVYANGYKIDTDDNILFPFLPDDHQETNKPEGILLDSYIAPSCALIRRRLIRKIGNFDESLLTTDHDFFIRASEKGKLAYLSKKVWAYRKHQGQISKNYKTRYDAFKTLRKAKKRHKYTLNVYRRRLAICHYYLAESLLWDKKYINSFYHFLFAGINDPRRSFRFVFLDLIRKY